MENSFFWPWPVVSLWGWSDIVLLCLVSCGVVLFCTRQCWGIGREYRKCLKENSPIDEKVLYNLNYDTACKFLYLCRQSEGIFLLAAEYIATRLHWIAPREVSEILANVELHRAPPRSVSEIQQVFFDEFQEYPENAFDKFEETPFHVSGTHQRHRATKDGKHYCVKIQFLDAARDAQWDINTIKFLSKASIYFFPGLSRYSRYVNEFVDHVRAKLNYENEARTTTLFNKQNSMDLKIIKSPEIFERYSRNKVITTELVHGIPIGNISGMKAAGIQPENVAKILNRSFMKQIFVHGHVYLYLKGNNILVEKSKLGEKIYFLGDTWFLQLDEDFRKNWCHFWRALILSQKTKPVDIWSKREEEGEGGDRDALTKFVWATFHRPEKEIPKFSEFISGPVVNLVRLHHVLRSMNVALGSSSIAVNASILKCATKEILDLRRLGGSSMLDKMNIWWIDFWTNVQLIYFYVWMIFTSL